MRLVETKDGTIIEVFAKPNQPKFKVTLEGEDIVIFSTQEPVKNKVNKEIIKELSRLFHAQVELAAGSTSREKKFIIKGATKAETERTIKEAYQSSGQFS